MGNLVHGIIITAPAWAPVVKTIGFILAAWIGSRYGYKIFKESGWISKREVTKTIGDERFKSISELGKIITELRNDTNVAVSQWLSSDKDLQKEEDLRKLLKLTATGIKLSDFGFSSLFILGASSKDSYNRFKELFSKIGGVVQSISVMLEEYKGIVLFELSDYEERGDKYAQRQSELLQKFFEKRDELIEITDELSELMREELCKGIEVHME